MKITIVRHGKPEPTQIGWTTSAALKQWIDAYNASPLSDTSQPSSELKEIAHNSDGIVCSNLPRSVKSAELFYRSKIILHSKLFSEAGLPYASWSKFKLPPEVWAILFRLCWLLGYSNNSESRVQAQARANDAANKLIQLAHTHGNIVYVGHGIFNRMVVRELLSSGWQGSRKPSSTHWGYSVYNSTKKHKRPNK